MPVVRGQVGFPSSRPVRIVQNGSGLPFPSRFQQADQLSKLKVLLADDHPNLLEKVASLLEPTFEVVGRVRDGQSLFDAAMNLHPDLIVSDISMPILNGIEAASKLKDAGCRSRVVFLTVHADPDYVSRCLVTGAHGYVVKCHMATDLLPAINEALAGRNFISQNFHP
jgi:DNA-binding NarL/FixJ family response regulator